MTQAGPRRLSSRSASFLLILPSAKRTAKVRQQIEHICQASSDLRTVYLLSQEFVTMLKERQVEALDSWLKQAKESQVTELVSFVNGITRDAAAVRAAFSLPWSNGIVEGHVKPLKISQATNVWPCSSRSVTRESSPCSVILDSSSSYQVMSLFASLTALRLALTQFLAFTASRHLSPNLRMSS